MQTPIPWWFIFRALALVLIGGCSSSVALIEDGGPASPDLLSTSQEAGDPSVDLGGVTTADLAHLSSDLSPPGPDMVQATCGTSGLLCCPGDKCADVSPGQIILTCMASQGKGDHRCIPATDCGGYLYPCCDTAGNHFQSTNAYCKIGYYCQSTGCGP